MRKRTTYVICTTRENSERSYSVLINKKLKILQEEINNRILLIS